MRCLVIDDNPKTAAVLMGLLQASAPVTEVNLAIQPYQVQALLRAGKVDVLFIRVRLWDYRYFGDHYPRAIPVVFLHGGKDKLTVQPGTAVRYSLREPYGTAAVLSLLCSLDGPASTESLQFLFLRYDGRFHKTRFADIELIERKEGSYVRFHLSYGSWLLPGTLPGWMAKLPAAEFVRLSDTLIVPASALEQVQGDAFSYKGRSIPLTYRFAAIAAKEMARWPDGL